MSVNIEKNHPRIIVPPPFSSNIEEITVADAIKMGASPIDVDLAMKAERIEPVYIETDAPLPVRDMYSKLYGDKTVKDVQQIWSDRSKKLFREYFTFSNPMKSHIEIFDNWIDVVLPKQYKSAIIKLPTGFMYFDNITYKQPFITAAGAIREEKLTPNDAINKQVAYTFQIRADIFFKENAKNSKPIIVKREFHVGDAPLMVGSKLCYTYGKSAEELLLMNIDIGAPNGYFIINGLPKIIVPKKTLRGNHSITYYNAKSNTVITAVKCFTELGSVYITLKLNNNILALSTVDIETGINRRSNKEMRKIVPPLINVLRIFHYFGNVYGNVEGDTLFSRFRTAEGILNYLCEFIHPSIKGKAISILTISMLELIHNPKSVAIFMALFLATEKSTITEKFRKNLFPRLDDYLPPEKRSAQYEKDDLTTFKYKLDMLAIMIAKTIDHITGRKKLDDRNDWSNNMVLTPGKLMEMTFNNNFHKWLEIIQENIETYTTPNPKRASATSKSRRSHILGPNDMLNNFETLRQTIGRGFIRTFNTSNFTSASSGGYITVEKLQTSPTIMVQWKQLTALTANAALYSKDIDIRSFTPDQGGLICAGETPEREKCGITVHRASTTQFSVDRGETAVESILSVSNSSDERHDNKSESHSCALMINGIFRGWSTGMSLAKKLRQLKMRTPDLYDIEIIIDTRDTSARYGFVREEITNTLSIYADGGRLIRPLLIVDDNGLTHIDNLNIKKPDINHWNLSFDELMKLGCIEYVGAGEQKYAYIAESVWDLMANLDHINEMTKYVNDKKLVLDQMQDKIKESSFYTDDYRKLLGAYIIAKKNLESALYRSAYSHCELDPTAFWGLGVGIIPWTDRAPPVRSILAAKHGQQAATTATNQLTSTDDSLSLMYPSISPIVKTGIYDILGLDNHPGVQNVVVAFAHYRGYTQEDSIIFKKEAIDRGMFARIKKTIYSVKIAGNNEKLATPILQAGDNSAHALNNGIPRLGSYLEEDHIVIGKIETGVKTIRGKVIDVDKSVRITIGGSGIVRRVYIDDSSGSRRIIVIVESVHTPQLGDKYASRSGQKSTLGAIIRGVDLPFISTGKNKGVIPDLLIDPTAMVSRSTLMMILEMLVGTYSTIIGKFFDASPFRKFNVGDIQRILRMHGYDYSGNETMISGTTGEHLKGRVFVGLCAYMSLKHIVEDKVRCSGDTHDSKKSVGREERTTRFGGYEINQVQAHGMARVAQEITAGANKSTTVTVCYECGSFAIKPNISGGWKCPKSGCPGKLGKVKLPNSFVYLNHMSSCALITMALTFTPITNVSILGLLEKYGFAYPNNKLKETYETSGPEGNNITIQMYRYIDPDDKSLGIEIIAKANNLQDEGYFLHNLGGPDAVTRDKELLSMVNSDGAQIKTMTIDVIYERITGKNFNDIK